MKTYRIHYRNSAYYQMEVEAESVEQAKEIFLSQEPSEQIGEDQEVLQDFEEITDIEEVHDERL